MRNFTMGDRFHNDRFLGFISSANIRDCDRRILFMFLGTNFIDFCGYFTLLLQGKNLNFIIAVIIGFSGHQPC